MESTYITLGMLGVWEIVMILVVMIFMTAALAGLIFLAIWLSKRTDNKAPSSSATDTVRLATCPRCGSSLPVNAPQGLCPRCVMQVGIGTQDDAEPAFRDSSGKPNPPDPAQLAVHFPQLEIIELLGQGGMGAVYKARQKDLDRMVALKVLPGGAGSDPAFAERFMREARALARLNHPNIVAVHDFGRTKEFYYFVMEFVEGPSLRHLMRNHRLSPREAMTIVPRICEALQFAHDEGIVHRDIKPENILVDLKGRVKIADFGIAKLVGRGRDPGLTGVRDVIGTPHYMAPEQVERPTDVDHRADIYSLGVVFYEMLTGELPLGKFAVPSKRVQVDVRLDEVVLHALEKEPERRYQHASEVKTDVETIASGRATSAVSIPSAGVEPHRQASARGSWQPAAAAILLVGCVLLWVAMGYLTYVQPVMIERAAELETELPTATRFFSQLGSIAHHLGFLLVPLLVLLTGGAFAWLLRSTLRPRSRGLETETPGSRFSRLAIVGACWMPLFFITTLLFLSVRTVAIPEGGPPPGPAWWQIGLSLTLLPLGWTAPFGTTICGVVALSQIRRSDGRLCGLGLALFDALAFPLLVLDALIVWLVYLLMCQSLEWVGFKPGTEVALETALLPGALIIIVVNVWLVRWAWGSVKRMTGRATTEAERKSAAAWARTAVPVSVLLLLGAAGLMVAAPLHSKRRVDEQKRLEQDRLEALRLREGEPDEVARPDEGGRTDSRRTAAAAVLETPPVVVRTHPPAGSPSVDPSLTELRVTFSKPMMHGCWSWVKLDDATFPEITGEARFSEDGRTCILPVHLEPERTYATWINVDAFQRFQDETGNPAIPYLLVFRTSHDEAATSMDPDAPRRVTVGRDGGAQFASIQQAIDAVAVGGTVEIGAGRYPERFEIRKPVELVGAGWDKTVVGPTEGWSQPSSEQMREMEQRFRGATSEEERARLREEFSRRLSPPVLSIQGATGVSLNGLKVTQPGVPPEDRLLSAAVIEVSSSALTVQHCAIVGAPYNGILLTDASQAAIRDSLIAAMWNRGVTVANRSRVQIRNCDIRNCYYAGVTVGRGSEAFIEACRISGAAWHGIRYDHVSPRIIGNLIFGNARSGIYASGKTAAQVRQNALFNNEMNGISCWSDNRDFIEGNTFVNNQREALSILGASAPTVRSNIFSGHPVAVHQGRIGGEPDSVVLGRPLVMNNLFWNNATNWARATETDTHGVWQRMAVELGDATRSRIVDPQFTDAGRGDVRLKPGSPALQQGIGALDPIPLASPWPLQPEERAIIPDGETRDSRQWKRTKRQARADEATSFETK